MAISSPLTYDVMRRVVEIVDDQRNGTSRNL